VTVIACIGHWYTDFLYMVPVVLMAGFVLRDKWRRHRSGGVGVQYGPLTEAEALAQELARDATGLEWPEREPATLS
jgi:hypothetical protein